MITVTVTDLASERRSDLIKLSQFLLEYAGYDAAVAAIPPVAMTPVGQEAAKRYEQAVEHMGVLAAEVPKVVFAHSDAFPELRKGEIGKLDTDITFVKGSPEEAMVNVFAQAPGIEVDSSGMPWDGRIHASSRARVADGTWRQRRNLEPATLTLVTSELKQTMAIPAPVVDVPIPPPFVPSAPVPAAPVAIVPPPPSTQAGAATTASPSNGATVTFPQLMQSITKAFTAKTLDQATIQAAVQSVGLPALPMLASRPDLVGAVATALGIAL